MSVQVKYLTPKHCLYRCITDPASGQARDACLRTARHPALGAAQIEILPTGQIREPALRADRTPCPGGRSENLPLLGQVRYPILHIMSVQVKYLTPKLT